MHLPSCTILAAALLLISSAAAQDTSLRTVKAKFDEANIPANASIVFDPTVLLEVAFPQTSGPAIKVKAGVHLPRNSTAIPPIFGIQTTNPTDGIDGNFVVAMVDLDAPTPQAPTSAEIRHFLGGNFTPLSSRTKGLSLLSNSTPAVTEFHQPAPPAGSDPHRYVFLLFSQPRNFNMQTEINSTTSITNFNISQFALEVGLGRPLGGTFILVGPDPTTAA